MAHLDGPTIQASRWQGGAVREPATLFLIHMPLTSGTQLGPYEIRGPLGAGGMGEVYRALDTQLDREVAVKVLPPALANDSERLTRFDREAKILAALNHSNIAAIYGLEKFDGGRALVMELVPGANLAERLQSGPFAPDDALRVARQIAEALEAAHEKNVVHRDLKPGNIMITPAGVIKVLDFGLAAVASPTPPAPGDPMNSPTLTMGMTQTGVIMGTASYMAPEQAAGSPVDRRADIWSFGVVLWEMLTGKRLFQGDSVAHTLADVLRAPIDFERVPAGPIRRLLKRCLDRNLKTRLQSIAEARIAIDEILTGADEPAPAPPATSKRNWLPWALAGFAALSTIALAAIHFREAPPAAPLRSLALAAPEGADFDFGNPYALPAISPDGSRIVFGARGKDGKRQLWLRRLDSSASQPLPGTENAALPFWSPDSRWVAFGQERKIKKIDTQGGPPVPVTEIQGIFRGGAWNKDGVMVLNTGSGGALRVSAAGGIATPLIQTPAYAPQFLPDGRHFLYFNDAKLYLASLEEPGKPGRMVAQTQSSASFSQGFLLFVRDGTLMAQPFDPTRLETTGEATPVAEGIPVYTTASRLIPVTVSSSGVLVCLQSSGSLSHLVWRDRHGASLGNLGEPLEEPGNVVLSPDGKSAVVAISSSSGQDLWIFDTARGIPTRFTSEPPRNREPVWTPDGKTIYFESDRKKPGAYDLYRKAANGSSAEELVAEGISAGGVSPDGQRLIVTVGRGGLPYIATFSLPLSSGNAEPTPFIKTQFSATRPSFSPTGKWVVYTSTESGQSQVYAAPYPGPGGKRPISPAAGTQARWSRNGKEIFYVTPEGALMAAAVAESNGTLEIGKVEKLFDYVPTNRGVLYDTIDGQKFLVADDGTSASRPLTVLENWTAILKK